MPHICIDRVWQIPAQRRKRQHHFPVLYWLLAQLRSTRANAAPISSSGSDASFKQTVMQQEKERNFIVNLSVIIIVFKIQCDLPAAGGPNLRHPVQWKCVCDSVHARHSLPHPIDYCKKSPAVVTVIFLTVSEHKALGIQNGFSSRASTWAPITVWALIIGGLVETFPWHLCLNEVWKPTIHSLILSTMKPKEEASF